MLPKGILFDLDDTIIAFDAVVNPTWQRLCDTYASALCDPTHLYNAIQEIRTWYWSDPVRHKWARHNLQQLQGLPSTSPVLPDRTIISIAELMA